MKDGRTILAASIEGCATEFIEHTFLPLLDNNMPKSGIDECIRGFIHNLMLRHVVTFVPEEECHHGMYLYLIHFENGELKFSIQHPTESQDDLSFLKFRTWASDPRALTSRLN
jgi:hypothetical protein